MARTFALISVALFLVTAGCRVGSHPYDYCGPLFDGPGGQYSCDPMARAGSILSPSPEMYGSQYGAPVEVIEGDVAPQPLQPIPQNELTRSRRIEPEELVESGPTLIQALSDANRGPVLGVEEKVHRHLRTDPNRWVGRQDSNSRPR